MVAADGGTDANWRTMLIHRGADFSAQNMHEGCTPFRSRFESKYYSHVNTFLVLITSNKGG
jgi:hypothetical protein